jgi:hypothetical protein
VRALLKRSNRDNSNRSDSARISISLEYCFRQTILGEYSIKRLTPERVAKGMIGDAYTYICLERSTKLVMAWHLGKRDRMNTEDFVSKIRWATAAG